jgi:hypothetical protein
VFSFYYRPGPAKQKAQVVEFQRLGFNTEEQTCTGDLSIMNPVRGKKGGYFGAGRVLKIRVFTNGKAKKVAESVSGKSL